MMRLLELLLRGITMGLEFARFELLEIHKLVVAVSVDIDIEIDTDIDWVD